MHWARDAAEHNAIVHGILAGHGVTGVVKSKSMLTEECGLNPYLKERGIEVVDTDLGERIVQLAGEPPSHIVMPAIHRRKESIGELFHEKLGTPAGLSDPKALTEAARQHLRRKFLGAHAARSIVAALSLWAIRHRKDGVLPEDGSAAVAMALGCDPRTATSIVDVLASQEVALLERGQNGLRIKGFRDAYGPLLARRKSDLERQRRRRKVLTTSRGRHADVTVTSRVSRSRSRSRSRASAVGVSEREEVPLSSAAPAPAALSEDRGTLPATATRKVPVPAYAFDAFRTACGRTGGSRNMDPWRRVIARLAATGKKQEAIADFLVDAFRGGLDADVVEARITLLDKPC